MCGANIRFGSDVHADPTSKCTEKGTNQKGYSNDPMAFKCNLFQPRGPLLAVSSEAGDSLLSGVLRRDDEYFRVKDTDANLLGNLKCADNADHKFVQQ